MELTVFGYPFELDAAVVDADRETIRRRVRAYERGDRPDVDLPVAFPDTFVGRVMRAMAAIPPGETRTYGDVARVVESSPVAVGGACGRNPVPLVVPCHRVVGADSLGGFSAAGGVAAKAALLAHERGDPVQRPLGGSRE